MERRQTKTQQERGKQQIADVTTEERILPPGTLSSLVSYPKRCHLWGDSRYRGNCDGTLFRDLVLQYGPRRVGDPMLGSGTTRDVVAWLNQTHGTRIAFWGGDLRTGFNLQSDSPPGHFDFIWIHPPYWNIIRYSEDAGDLSNIPEYDAFISNLQVCLRRCHDALTLGGRLAVLVGDVRRKGMYYPIVRDVLNMDGEIGALRSVIIKAQHNCQSDGKVYARMEDPPIKHEYCVVFKRVS